MTADGLTVVEAGADHLDAIRALYHAVRGNNRPLDYDRWRFFGSPDGACPSAIAMDGERVAGFYTLWPVRLRIGDEVVLGGQSMDTMTHPDYLRRGIFVQLAQACYDIAAARGYQVLYGFPNTLSYAGFVKNLGWQHTGDIRHWVRLIRPSRHPRVPRALGPLADLGASLIPRGAGHGCDIVDEAPAATELDALMRDWLPGPGLCRVERTPEWLAWRYSDAAEHGYEWVSARRSDKIVAAGVWGMQNANWGEVADGRGHLVELIGSDPQGLRAVTSAIIGRAEARGAWIIETVTNIPATISALRRGGFFSHRAAPLIVRALSERPVGANIHDHGAWRFMGGDLDTM